MCFAVPGMVVKLEGQNAIVDFGGATRRANISLLDEVNTGDYVLVHVGYAIQKLSKKDALETIELWKKILGAERDEF